MKSNTLTQPCLAALLVNLIVLSPLAARGQIETNELVHYGFCGPFIPDGCYTPTFVARHVSATAMTNSSSITTFAFIVGGTYPYSYPEPVVLTVNPGTNSTGYDSTRYFEFTVTAGEGARLNLNRLTFQGARGGTSGTRGCRIRTSMDNYGTNLFEQAFPTARSTFTTFTVTMNFTNQSSVTFRVYPYASTGTVDFDNFRVFGWLSPLGEVHDQTRVETAPDGSGQVLSATNLTAGDSITVYAIARDADGNFVTNTPALWSLTNVTGGVVEGDLVVATDRKSATFTAARTGSAQIRARGNATNATAPHVVSETVTVVTGPATQVRVESAADGSGTVLAGRNLAVTRRKTVTGYAIARDIGGNFLTNLPATWSLQNVTGSIVSEDLTPASDGRSAVFTAYHPGTATLHASVSGLTSVDSGIMTNYTMPLAISGYMADPAGTDSPFEYVQLIALEPIDFTVTPMSVVFVNNGVAAATGWRQGGSVTYKFNLTTGALNPGDVAYVGGDGKRINGSGSTDISAATWLRAINTGTTGGDGFGNAASGGVLGNDGANADAIGVFMGTDVNYWEVPVDAVFFGNSVGQALFDNGNFGYTMPFNDWYDGGYLQANSPLVAPAPTTGGFTRLTGTYNTNTFEWTTTRISSVLASPTSLADIASTITFMPAEPTSHASDVVFSDVEVTSMTVSWTSGNGAKRIVVVREGAATSWVPTDGPLPSGVNADFSLAADKGGGNKICYAGADDSFSLSGLAVNTTYYVTVFEYNDNGVNANYLTSGTPGAGNQTTACINPVGGADTLGAVRNTPVSVAAVKLKANDSGTGLTIPAFTDTTAQGGTVALATADGTLTYTPPPDYSGPDSFTYPLRNTYGCEVAVTVNVTVESGTSGSPNVVFTGVHNGNFVARFAGIPGYTYTVETNSVPSGPGWAKLGNVTAPTVNDPHPHGVGIFEIIDPLGDASRYYRTVWPAY